MDLARLRFGDWVMGIAAVAVLVVMFLDWYGSANAWQSFAVNDVILALAAVMAIVAVVLIAVQPTAAVPLALTSLATLVSLLALILVVIRVIWPPQISDVDVARDTGAWLGLVAIAALVGGCLASIRDERLPRPQRTVEPRLVEP